MIPPKNNWCVRTLIICCVALSIATSNAVPKEKMLRIPWRHGGYLLISTVDWYKEPPENFSSAGHVAEIYHDLVKVVPRSLHSEAIALLANTDVLELTKEQAKHFGFQADPDSVLQSLTHAIAERRRNNQERNADVKAGRDP